MEHDCILEKREINLRNRSIGQVKVQWKHLGPDEATWELESKIRETCPILEDDVELKGGCLSNTPRT